MRYCLIFCLFLLLPLNLRAEFNLLNQLSGAEKGVYFVTLRNKNYTLLLIRDKTASEVTVEEVTIPKCYRIRNQMPWNQWLQSNAPWHTAWVRYRINLETGKLKDYYSFNRQSWIDISETDNLLTKLMSLRFERVPDYQRKKIGYYRGKPRFWQPKMVVNGEIIPNVEFSVWKTRWPKDGSELSNMVIHIYLPENTSQYPSHFPYCLKVFGMVTKTELRIIDSGQLIDNE